MYNNSFFDTVAGQRFIEGTVPNLVKAIEGLTEELAASRKAMEKARCVLGTTSDSNKARFPELLLKLSDGGYCYAQDISAEYAGTPSVRDVELYLYDIRKKLEGRATVHVYGDAGEEVDATPFIARVAGFANETVDSVRECSEVFICNPMNLADSANHWKED